MEIKEIEKNKLSRDIFIIILFNNHNVFSLLF